MPDNPDIKSAKPKKRPLIVSGNATNVLQESRDAVVLLSGGNPQIAKGYGNQPVQDYIAEMTERKRATWPLRRKSLTRRCLSVEMLTDI